MEKSVVCAVSILVPRLTRAVYVIVVVFTLYYCSLCPFIYTDYPAHSYLSETLVMSHRISVIPPFC